MESLDRRCRVSSDEGRNILPNFPLFNKLLRLAYDAPEKTAIRDDNLAVEKSRVQLLTDLLRFAEVIKRNLSAEATERLRNKIPVYIAVLAPGGYEYVVAVLAALSLGLVLVPIATVLPLEEAIYFIQKSGSVSVLTSMGCDKLGSALEQGIQKLSNPSFKKISIAPHFQTSALQANQITTYSGEALDDNAPGIVIFTSGTTGKPKGAIHRRSLTHETARALADHYKITEDDVILHLLPVHHATGACVSFFPFLISGAVIEYRSGSFDASWTWDRWRKGGLTFFTGVPTIYMRMMRYYEQHIAKLAPAVRDEYIAGAKQFRAMLCGTSALPRPIQDFWTKMRDGKVILTRYGGTESGAVCKVTLDPGATPDGSVGEVIPGATVKLTDGDEGEMLIKCNSMFSGYLNDKQATLDAHDADGFYKTGDIVRREGKYYFILGRANIDVLKSGGYKISALDIEREALGLPYIHEVMVVGVEDEEWGQRVAAVVTLRGDQTQFVNKGKGGGAQLTLDRFREDLSSKLARYKLPTLLRVVEGELPKTVTGKVVKKSLGPMYFPKDYRQIPDVQVWSPKSKKTSKL